MIDLKSIIFNPESRIYALLAIFIVLSSLYSVVVPPFEASDELWHYPMVEYIADHWALPVQDPENVGPWRQEGSQPPLYYFIGAVATFWIDTSDMDVVRHLNPHADNGVVTIDGNVNLITHHPEAESFPWRGTTLAVHLIRFVSILMGATTVYLTYRLALELMPNRPGLALGAAAINAFTPMFLFISAAVNNDNLVVPLCSVALLLIVRIIQRELAAPDRETRILHHTSRFICLGVVVGLALLAKESAGGLVFLTALTVAYVAWSKRSWRTFLIGGVATGGPTLLIAGWWYLRNWQLYGDPSGQNVFIEILGQRDVPADLAQLWRERVSFVRSYWGNFGGLNVPMAEWVYVIFDALLVLAALGLILAVAMRLWSLLRTRSGRQGRLVSDSAGVIGLRAPWLIVLLWPISVVVLWITWAATTWSSQGRLVFSAISVWSLLLALGWYTWTLPLKDRVNAVLANSLRMSAFLCVPLFMFVVSLIAPWAWIRPAYARPPALSDAQVAAISQRVDAVFFHPAGGQLKLLGYEAPAGSAYPGQPVPLTLYWETVEPFAQDYSVFVHLVDEHDLITAQRDAFPGMGALSTRWLEPGQRWAERRVLALPDTAFSPNRTVFEVGVYDYATQQRLAMVDAGGQIAGDNVRFGQVEVLAREGVGGEGERWPNPMSIDFEGEIELVGYDLARRALRPGETTTLTLYWRGQRPIKVNYSISTQFVDEHGVKAAQQDAWPFDGAMPTVLWEPGALIEEPRELAIFDGASPGVYDVYIAVYPSGDPGARLAVTPTGGRLQTDHVVLTTVRVLP